MINRPTSDEMLAAVSGFIERVAPGLKDRDAFLARVAINAVGTVRREQTNGLKAERDAIKRLSALLERNGRFEALIAELGNAIRAGAFDDREDALLDVLKALAIDQVRIDQPNYSGLKAALAAPD